MLRSPHPRDLPALQQLRSPDLRGLRDPYAHRLSLQGLCEGSAKSVQHLRMVGLWVWLYCCVASFHSCGVPGYPDWWDRLLRLVPDRRGCANCCRGDRRRRTFGDGQTTFTSLVHYDCGWCCRWRSAYNTVSISIREESLWCSFSSDLSCDCCPCCLLPTFWNPIVQITYTSSKRAYAYRTPYSQFCDY